MKASFENWMRRGWIERRRTSPAEIRDLLAIVDRDLEQAAIDGLTADWRMNIAYNAALQCATIALRASGYRSRGGSHHLHTIESLPLTCGVDQTTTQLLQQFRQKRSRSIYDAADAISESEAREMQQLAGELRAHVVDWLKAKHPHLHIK